MSWSVVWLAVFAAALAAFTLISLVIAVRGVAEIRKLFADLENAKRRGPS